MIGKIIKKSSISVFNFLIFLLGLIIGKSKKYILLGSWMGERYADNTRYLFDYLSSNKKKLGLKKVVWATRSKSIYNELKDNGFDVVIIGTPSSFFFHLKSKMHIICNSRISDKRFLSDIDSYLSAGAFKIQLWHGNGIKRVPGKHPNKNKTYNFMETISTPGLWHPSKMIFLCKCDLDYTFFHEKFGITQERCVDASYPRTCKLNFLTADEKRIIKFSKAYSKTIIYLPTFRNDYSHYVHPLKDKKIIRYLEENNVLWIEKPHLADDFNNHNHNNSNNVLFLKNTLDINVLFPLCDLLITDYSSAMLDALFFYKQIIYYVPDFDYYKENDRGFLIDFDSITVSDKVRELDELYFHIVLFLNENKCDSKYIQIRNLFWKNDKLNCSDIWNRILLKLGIKYRK